MHVFGVTLIGANAANGRKLLLTLALLAGVFLFRYGVMALVRVVTGKSPNERVVFWTRQAVNIVAAVFAFVVVASIWFDNPSRLAGVMGLLAAGIAVALQRVITSLAGYIVIMRGKTFSVGDRITMGGVRGDVIALGFIQTTILEMGQPASVSEQTPPAMWVHGRQATGRLVHVSNAQVFDEPIYNYTHELRTCSRRS